VINLSNIKQGYVQIYTGNGKGKTTAAIGLGVRAAGHKYKVIMVQFLKANDTGELYSIKQLEPYFKIFRFEKKRDFFWNLTDEQKVELKNEIKEAYEFVENILKYEKCDILILDEIMGTLKNKLIEEEDVLHLIDIKPKSMELISTGRNVPQNIIEKADLVTEMKDIKHYFKEGVASREGIEY
jgi:cob(I)alamin adenosyltransferase